MQQRDQATSEGSYFALMSPALAGFLGFSFWRGLEMVAAGVLVKEWIRTSLGAGLAVFCLVALVRAQFRFRRWRDNQTVVR